ncbi:MAG: DMT family transporter [Roseobacter sp.]
MRILLLTSFTMLAFASNSILTRLAVEGQHIDPVSFAVVRVFSGAAVLVALVLIGSGRLPWRSQGRVIGAISLLVYMIGFSIAYVSLDAGLGALILFGVVQITMFTYAACRATRPTVRQLAGASIAFIGLIIALWPNEGASTNLLGAFSMVLAGIGWAAYTLSGKSGTDPLAETAVNFAICLPILALLSLPFFEMVSVTGLLLGVLCGGLTSGLGYALWYKVLSDIQPSSAAVVQLSVPIIAIVGGAILLGEPVTQEIVLAAAFVICGIGLAVTSRSSPKGRSTRDLDH